MLLHLVAVQAALREDVYADADSFAGWVMDLGERALARLPGDGAPALLAFPELIALPLTFTLGPSGATSRGSPSLVEAAFRSLRGDWRAVLAAAVQHRAVGPSAVHLARALDVHRAYVAAFRAVARETGTTVVAGSALLPEIDVEASRGAHVTGGRVHNVAYTFAPGGSLIGRSRKVFLTPGLESRGGIARARVAELPTMCLPWGRLGVAVCLDGWYEGVLAHLDACGAQVVVQPSANDADWARPWPPDPRLSEGEAWLTRGMNARLQGRVNVRYGVNPMLAGEAFGFRPRGRSSILANAALAAHGWVDDIPGVLALAPDSEGEAFVQATVDLSEATGAPVPAVRAGGRMRP